MKLFETIVTYPESIEIYKRYDYFKTLKECKAYMNTFGMEIVRLKEVSADTMRSDILEIAKKQLIERVTELI